MQRRFRWLLAWVGRQDLEGAALEHPTGPVVTLLERHPCERALLLSNWDEPANISRLVRTIESRTETRCTVRQVALPDPTDYLPIYNVSLVALEEAVATSPLAEIAIQQSSGTPAMAAVWLLLAKTRFAGVSLFKGWRDAAGRSHVAAVEFPFDIAVDVLPALSQTRGALMESPLPPPGFEAIVARGPAMLRVLETARRAALFPSPVLILGESGTGKELLARAIHATSPRSKGPWTPMNCGSLPSELVDAELFGAVRGAFTGATADRIGRFEASHNGTLFLDEVGDMPLETQVRLLRVLQEGEFQRLGETRTRKADVRILSATHRDLTSRVSEGHFRSDLFYRLAVIILRIPPLRDRREDIVPIAESLLARLNERASRVPGVQTKRLTPSAREFLKAYPWPGNVRELDNTLARLVALVPGETIQRDDLEANVLAPKPPATGPIPGDFDLPRELDRIERTYIEKAMAECAGVKQQVARRLGYASRQALDHRLRVLGLSR